MKPYDPRIKIILVMILTGVIIFDNSLWTQFLVTGISFALSIYLKGDIIGTFRKLRHFLVLFGSVVLIQSVFRQTGDVYLEWFGISLLTKGGIRLALNYIFRVTVIILSGTIIATSSMRNTLQGFSQMGVPYVIGLMTSIGVRFMPILMEEINNTYTSMELRGINIKALRLKRRIDLIGRLFVPIVYSALIRAKRLSESIEMRGYIIGGKRSSYYRLKFQLKDLCILLCVLTLVIIIVI